MRLWDLNTGKQASVFSVDGYPIALAYSAKARLAATYTWTRIRLWDLETGKEVRKWTGHGHDFNKVCFSPDGKRLVSASLDGTVRIWLVPEMPNEGEQARADEASAVKAVENLGGKVTRDDKLPGNPVIGVNLGGLFPGKVTDAGLKELKDLKQLNTLDLYGTPVTDAGLKELADLKQLTTLNLSGTQVTNAGLKELKDLKQLTTLKLRNVTDAGLAELKDLKQLTSLNLGATGVTADGVADLQKALPGCKIGR